MDCTIFKNPLFLIRKRKNFYSYSPALIVLPPGMIALRAPEEPHLALICSPELAEPPDCKVVPALGALDLDGGHGFYFIVLIIHDRNLIFRTLFSGLHLVSCPNLADIPAFTALELAPGRDQHRLAFRTEHRYTMRDERRLNLASDHTTIFLSLGSLALNRTGGAVSGGGE
jgi:hypothetical protein